MKKNSIMEKEQIKQEMLGLISKEIDQWFEAESSIKEGYEYEEKFMSLAQRVGRILLDQSIGISTRDRNKKNSKRVLGK